MTILPITTGPVQTTSYLVCDRKSRDALIVDAPPESADTLLAAVRRLSLTVRSIVITHGHFDHLADAAALREATGAPLCIHELDADDLRRPSSLGFPLPFPLRAAVPDMLLREGDVIPCGALSFAVLHVPGHTRGHVCLHERSEGVLFSGDTLFHRSVGRTDLPGGSYDALMEHITAKLLTLPDATIVYPGHGPCTTIGDERRDNMFLLEYRDHFDV